MSFRNRIHYKNIFLHIGHLQTIFYNNSLAEENNGICYAIVDDRQNKMNATNLKCCIKYLNVKNIEIIEVTKYQELLVIYTKELLKSGEAYIYPGYNSNEDLSDPHSTFQIRLNYVETPTIGYTKKNSVTGKIETVFIFDYIIKVLDEIKKVTDVVTISSGNNVIGQDITDHNILNFFSEIRKINYTHINSYRIYSFRYSKKDWPDLSEGDARLLTIQGLKARHVPYQVLFNFYSKASEKGSISINDLDNLLKTYLNCNSNRVSGILNPLKVYITNMSDKHTDFISRYINPLDKSSKSFIPLSNVFYMDKHDFALVENDRKLSVHKEIKLKNGRTFYCNNVILDDKGYPNEVKGMYYNKESNNKENTINWISSEYGIHLQIVKYYKYNWFFTGNNDIFEPTITYGYIDNIVFSDLDNVYLIDKVGYFCYDKKLSTINNIPCFIGVSNTTY
jgi:glutamyl/glutaminyl-tRNA synthetase